MYLRQNDYLAFVKECQGFDVRKETRQRIYGICSEIWY